MIVCFNKQYFTLIIINPVKLLHIGRICQKLVTTIGHIIVLSGQQYLHMQFNWTRTYLHETAGTDLYSLLVDSNLMSNPSAPIFLIVVTANVNGKILRAF